MGSITKLKGNIFNSKCDVLINPVNCQGFMGKGLALEFKLLYPNMMEKYIKYCENKALDIGKIALINETKKKILLFPTKKSYSLPSKLEYIEKGLIKIKETYIEKGIESIAMPQIGAGLGGLNWKEVEELIYKIFADININIEIYSYKDEKAYYIDDLKYILENSTIKEIHDFSNISIKALELIKDNINGVNSLSDFLKVKGLGNSSVEKISKILKYKIKEKKKVERKIVVKNMTLF